jgi:hypothetical protein
MARDALKMRIHGCDDKQESAAVKRGDADLEREIDDLPAVRRVTSATLLVSLKET